MGASNSHLEEESKQNELSTNQLGIDVEQYKYRMQNQMSGEPLTTEEVMNIRRFFLNLQDKDDEDDQIKLRKLRQFQFFTPEEVNALAGVHSTGANIGDKSRNNDNSYGRLGSGDQVIIDSGKDLQISHDQQAQVSCLGNCMNPSNKVV